LRLGRLRNGSLLDRGFRYRRFVENFFGHDYLVPRGKGL
jgi:hypothetical protein